MNPIPRTDPAWRNLKLWLGIEIRAQQRQLELVNPLVSESEHNVTRGRIAALRGIIAAVEPESGPQVSEGFDYDD